MASRSGWKARLWHDLTIAAGGDTAGGDTAGGDTGSATVFFFGSLVLPRFRWVASHWGNASCMRHYGAGRSRNLTACKVTQYPLRCRQPRTQSYSKAERS